MVKLWRVTVKRAIQIWHVATGQPLWLVQAHSSPWQLSIAQMVNNWSVPVWIRGLKYGMSKRVNVSQKIRGTHQMDLYPNVYIPSWWWSIHCETCIGKQQGDRTIRFGTLERDCIKLIRSDPLRRDEHYRCYWTYSNTAINPVCPRCSHRVSISAWLVLADFMVWSVGSRPKNIGMRKIWKKGKVLAQPFLAPLW